jgi:hypothetical protein
MKQAHGPDPYAEAQQIKKGELYGIIGPRDPSLMKGGRYWDCELCGNKNRANQEGCKACGRARLPKWLKLSDNSDVKLGMLAAVGAEEAQSLYVRTNNLRCFRLHILNATGLAQADAKGKSDPYVLVYFNDQLIGQTEHIENDHDPVWMDEYFLIPMPLDVKDSKLRIEVRDHDPKGMGDFLGQVVIWGKALNKLPKKNKIYQLEKSSKREKQDLVQGHICVHFEQDPEPCDVLKLNISKATELANCDATGKSDPYVMVFYNDIKVHCLRCTLPSLHTILAAYYISFFSKTFNLPPLPSSLFRCRWDRRR